MKTDIEKLRADLRAAYLNPPAEVAEVDPEMIATQQRMIDAHIEMYVGIAKEMDLQTHPILLSRTLALLVGGGIGSIIRSFPGPMRSEAADYVASLIHSAIMDSLDLSGENKKTVLRAEAIDEQEAAEQTDGGAK